MDWPSTSRHSPVSPLRPLPRAPPTILLGRAAQLPPGAARLRQGRDSAAGTLGGQGHCPQTVMAWGDEGLGGLSPGSPPPSTFRGWRRNPEQSPSITVTPRRILDCGDPLPELSFPSDVQDPVGPDTRGPLYRCRGREGSSSDWLFWVEMQRVFQLGGHKAGVRQDPGLNPVSSWGLQGVLSQVPPPWLGHFCAG